MTMQQPLTHDHIDGDEPVSYGAPAVLPRPLRAVKFVKDAPDLIEGLAIPFGGPIAGKDFDGEHFEADTDLCLPWFGPTGRPVIYGHGLNPAAKTEVVGRQVALEQHDDGQWVQVELDKRSRYRAKIGQLVDQGALSFSSGAMPHLVQTQKDGKIVRWPWVELSLTPTPANPFAAVYAVKSTDIVDHFAAADIHLPAPLAAALKALDEWADIRDGGLRDGLPYADESARLLDTLKAFVERTQRLAGVRVKEGRTLSAASRSRMTSHVAALSAATEALQAAMADMQTLLASTDPAAGKHQAEALLAEWDFIASNLPNL